MRLQTIAKREIKLGFRNSWTYTFLILLIIFTLAILLFQSGVPDAEGYTDMMGAMMNVTLYLLPLITLLLGGISTVTEKEDGHWQLLSTYGLSTYLFLWGKWIGLLLILITMIIFSFGLSGIITVIFGKDPGFSSFLFFFLFASLLAIVYLGLSIGIGAIAKNRWQALIIGIGIWFLTIVLWPTLLISFLTLLPYSSIKPTLEILTFLNPAELVRIFSMVKLDAGSVFGPEYLQWVTWADGPFGIPVFIAIISLWIITSITVGGFIWKRRGWK